MKSLKVLTLVILFITSAAQAELAAPPVAKNWEESKAALVDMTLLFKSKKMTSAQKIENFPNTNMLLVDTQNLRLSKAEKAEQIRTIVNLLSATYELDSVNSNTDTVYDLYKANKQAFLAEINKVTDVKTRIGLKDAFDGWEDAEKSAHSEASEDSEGSIEE